jgi:hypothetical protein
VDKKNRTVKRWFTVVATLVFILVLFIVVRTQGYVSGSEFSPTHFQQREFSFYEIPLIHLQITPIKRSSATPSTAIYVRQNGLIATPAGTPDYWHLVSISRGLTGSTPADAQLLIDQLELGDSGDEYWRTWSKDHPQQAKILWAVIQDLSVRELYILMPPLFELAQIDHSPEELKTAIDTRLQAEYVQLIKDMRDADRGELATALLSEALSDFPANEELQRLQISENG